MAFTAVFAASMLWLRGDTNHQGGASISRAISLCRNQLESPLSRTISYAPATPARNTSSFPPFPSSYLLLRYLTLPPCLYWCHCTGHQRKPSGKFIHLHAQPLTPRRQPTEGSRIQAKGAFALKSFFFRRKGGIFSEGLKSATDWPSFFGAVSKSSVACHP